MFLRHLAEDAPWRLKEVRLAEPDLRSWKERRWLDVPALEI